MDNADWFVLHPGEAALIQRDTPCGHGPNGPECMPDTVTGDRHRGEGHILRTRPQVTGSRMETRPQVAGKREISRKGQLQTTPPARSLLHVQGLSRPARLLLKRKNE